MAPRVAASPVVRTEAGPAALWHSDRVRLAQREHFEEFVLVELGSNADAAHTRSGLAQTASSRVTQVRCGEGSRAEMMAETGLAGAGCCDGLTCPFSGGVCCGNSHWCARGCMRCCGLCDH